MIDEDSDAKQNSESYAKIKDNLILINERLDEIKKINYSKGFYINFIEVMKA